MPRFSDRFLPPTPKYRKHRASGQAVVTLYGRDSYLGPHGTKASRIENDRLIGEWLAAGRPAQMPSVQNDITVVELAAAYRKYASSYYVKHGKPTDTIHQVNRATEIICERYARTNANEFGPLAFKAVKAELVGRNMSRGTINHMLSTIRRMFRWGVTEELIHPTVLQALVAVPNVPKGRGLARELPPVTAVEDWVVDETLPYLPTLVADMVRFQRLTGARPGEVCILRPCDVDMSEKPWTFRPESYKTEHHDQDRIVVIGPKAQEVLRPYLLRDKEAYSFVPAEGERKRNALRRENRQSPMTPSQANRQPKMTPRWRAGSRYTTDS
jgi:integrase